MYALLFVVIQDQHLRMTVDKSKRKCVHSVHHYDNGHMPAGACHEAMQSYYLLITICFVLCS